jgi:hypothetical protein
MGRAMRLVPYVLVGVVSLSASYYLVRARQSPAAPDAPLSDMTDSARLENAGYGPGTHLSAYVFLSSTCGVCSRRDVKASVASIRDSLQAKYRGRFKRITVVGIAVDSDVPSGLKYLDGLGFHRFDELDVGGGWLNEQVTKQFWRAGTSRALVPQVVLSTRRVESQIGPPLRIDVESDTVIRVVRGGPEVVSWVALGVPLEVRTTITAPATAPSSPRH